MSEQVTSAELTEIEERANAATAGPWEANGKEQIEASCRCLSCWERALGVWEVESESGEDLNAETDATFIAHARTDVPRLIAEVKRLQAKLEKTGEALSEADQSIPMCDEGIRNMSAEEAQDGLIDVLLQVRDIQCEVQSDE